MKKYHKMIFIVTLLLIAWMIWISRYSLRYQYDLWRLDHTTAGSDIEDLNNDIRAMGEHIVPQLENTYKDIKKSNKQRSAAAWALIKVDRSRAESLFLPYLLESNDEAIVAQAIYDLGRDDSINAYPAIVKSLNSPKVHIRLAVVSYLGQVNMPRSISLLQQIKENDPSKDVQNAATYRLQLLGVLPLR